MSRQNSTDKFSKLLNPVKDPESSFNINITELLQEFRENYIAGSVNFNSAALLIQGSSSIYGKKVEYLHNLVTSLYACLVKNKKGDGVQKDAKEKEKRTREAKFNDPFCSTEIKMGKNLSCLRKKFSVKNTGNKKASKKTDKKYTFIPVDLLPLEAEEKEKGMVIKDAEGSEIGNKADFTLNKCKVSSSGWLLLPTVSPDLIPTEFQSQDYSIEDEVSDDNGCYDDMPCSSPLDEGYPPSSGDTETPSSVPSSQVPSSQGTDEGLGSLPSTPQDGESQPEPGTSTEGTWEQISNENTPGTPMECIVEASDGLNNGIEGNENIPLDDADVAPRPRRSMRNALQVCQLQEDEMTPKQPEENAPTVQEKEAVAVKKAIQKKNTCNLPSKLKTKDGEKALYPASEFCARTFFSMDRVCSKQYANIPELETAAFKNNSRIIQKFQRFQRVLSNCNEKKRQKEIAGVIEENNDDGEEIDPDGAESNMDDPVTNDDDFTPPPLEADDIVIENNPQGLPVSPSDNENPLAEDEPMFVDDLDEGLPAFNAKELEDSFANAARLQCELFREDLQKYVQTSDISERVHKWEATMKPFLSELNEREEFDINLYGSRILNSFGDTNRKQTITFRNFCKGKEKWEIHRYFMALLPLVNIGNVSIESQQSEGEDDISVTLLSRKMHHKELEEFGHNEGEHS